MLPIKRKGRARNFNVKPFPTDTRAVAYFTGLDFEVFDDSSIKAIYESGCYGINPKPRQTVMFNKQQKMKTISEAEYKRRLEWKEKFGEGSSEEMILVGEQVLPDPFNIPQSLVLFLEEAFFLHHTIDCLEIRDLDDNQISTEDLWSKLCTLKEKFVESYIAYLYLKSKNWVIKSGMKFGGDFRKLSKVWIISFNLNLKHFSSLQTWTSAFSRFIHRHRI